MVSDWVRQLLYLVFRIWLDNRGQIRGSLICPHTGCYYLIVDCQLANCIFQYDLNKHVYSDTCLNRTPLQNQWEKREYVVIHYFKCIHYLLKIRRGRHSIVVIFTTMYNIMWSSLSVTCDRWVVFSRYSGSLHQ